MWYNEIIWKKWGKGVRYAFVCCKFIFLKFKKMKFYKRSLQENCVNFKVFQRETWRNLFGTIINKFRRIFKKNYF